MSAEAIDWAKPPLVEVTFPVDIPENVPSQGAHTDHQGLLSQSLTMVQQAKQSLTDDEFCEPMERMVSLANATIANVSPPSKVVSQMRASSKTVKDLMDSHVVEPPPFTEPTSQSPMAGLVKTVEEFTKFKNNEYQAVTKKASAREEARQQLAQQREDMQQFVKESQAEVERAEASIKKVNIRREEKIKEADAAIAVCVKNHADAEAEVEKETMLMQSIDAQIIALEAQKEDARKLKQKAMEKERLTKTSIETANAQKTSVDNAYAAKVSELNEFQKRVTEGKKLASKGLRVVELLMESSVSHDKRITMRLHEHMRDAKKTMARLYGLELFQAHIKFENAKEMIACAAKYGNRCDAHNDACAEAEEQMRHCRAKWDESVKPLIHRPTLQSAVDQLVSEAIYVYVQDVKKGLRDDTTSLADVQMEHESILAKSIMKAFDEAPEGEGSAYLPGAAASLQVFASPSGSAPASVTEEEESGGTDIFGKLRGVLFGKK